MFDMTLLKELIDIPEHIDKGQFVLRLTQGVTRFLRHNGQGASRDYFEGFINEEARQLNKTLPEIKAWTPPKRVAKGQRGRGTKKGKKSDEDVE